MTATKVRGLITTLRVILNLIQVRLVVRRLRVKPAMTNAPKVGFWEAPFNVFLHPILRQGKSLIYRRTTSSWSFAIRRLI